ncbi:antitermination protein Q [Pseudomonas aestusnigri]|uniref:antiterminator Q family protein n=1 Tax=Halopseudomonas aestusnigri TaxID=857252 RepID=UPI001D1925B6|nr:antiterminator Q family protein [Halopseudomonas aestusnigri]MCC4260796.1 antitermination protein Q [Halopseudomonas aestusnigri]
MTKRRVTILSGSTEWLLDQWGLWRMSGMGVPRYVSPAFALMRDNVEQNTAPSFNITDEAAGLVDQAVARLGIRDSQMADCIWLYYGARYTQARVGRYLQISETKAAQLIAAGVAWVDGRLETIREAA